MEDKLNRDVTIGIKTFIRPECCIRLINSIRKHYKGIHIIVVDDGDVSPDLSSFKNVTHIKIPFDSGVSVGRNLLIDSTKTKYYLNLDDDSILSENIDISEAYKILEENEEIDMVGGKMVNTIYHGILEKKEGTLYFYKEKERRRIKNMPIYDIVHNFYMVRTEKIKKIRYEPELKTVDHTEFFWRASKKHNLVITMTNKMSIINGHTKNNERYNSFRGRIKEFRTIAYSKMGIKKMVIV